MRSILLLFYVRRENFSAMVGISRQIDRANLAGVSVCDEINNGHFALALH